VTLLFNGYEEVHSAMVEGHVDEWVARALAHERERLDGVGLDEVSDWGAGRASHLWWLVSDEEGPVDLSRNSGPGRAAVTVVEL
jgi:hypothetical protein